MFTGMVDSLQPTVQHQTVVVGEMDSVAQLSQRILRQSRRVPLALTLLTTARPREPLFLAGKHSDTGISFPMIVVDSSISLLAQFDVRSQRRDGH